MTTEATPQEAHQVCEWLLTLPAFYAEFAPLARHSHAVDHLYVFKDSGLLTAVRRSAFASPFRSVAFSFPAEGGGGRVTLTTPTFGHRKRKKVFSGWAFGVRNNPASSWPAAADRPPFADCLARLAQIVSKEPSSTAILKILDQFLDEEAKHTQLHGTEVHGFLHLSQSQTDVRDAATRLGRSARTLQRKVRTLTGLSPKQLLSVERFQRAVRTVPAPNDKLAHVAGDLKFADQAHLTREFRRHAGLTPGAFRKIWGASPGLAVRFFQDGNSTGRLRLAAWATDNRR